MTTYDDYLSLLKASFQNACDYIPKMCKALRKENPLYSNRDIRVRVRKDCKEAGIGSSTITHNIPKEFKNPFKVEAGKKGAKKKKKLHLQNKANSQDLEISKDKREPVDNYQRPKEEPEKLKILVPISSSGASVSAAENSPESQSEPNLEILEIPKHMVDHARKQIVDTNEWHSNDEDVEILKIQLKEQTEENQQKDIIIKQLQEEKLELSEIIKKGSFIPAADYKPGLPTIFEFPEPDDSTTFVWKSITFDELRFKLGALKATADTKINVYLERVPA